MSKFPDDRKSEMILRMIVVTRHLKELIPLMSVDEINVLLAGKKEK